MSITIGLVANVYNEARALPGWLETHLPFFDDVSVLHAGPGGEYSNDGTIEILEKWRVPVKFCSIDEGFGVVRTRAARMSPCDYVMILDADERFFRFHQVLTCLGESTPHAEADAILQSYDFRDLKTMIPNWENIARLGANLYVEAQPGILFDQGSYLRDILTPNPTFAPYDAVATIRRHWHDLALRRPTQNWHSDPDWQLRLIRNDPSIYFAPEQKMHERLEGVANIYHADQTRGPFFDHFHFTFKRMEQEQRAHDVAIYDAIHAGKTPPTQEEFVK